MRFVRRLVLLLLALPFVVFVFVTIALVALHQARGLDFSYEHNGTDLTFVSSDGGWRSEEDMLRGRDFEDVLVDFELYRIRSGSSDAQLLRTKPWKRPYKWAWWFDRKSSAKWKVPYVPTEEAPRNREQNFARSEPTPEEMSRARAAAIAYLRTLR